MRSVYIYVCDVEAAAQVWNLRPSEAAPNILLIEPKSAKDVVFTNTSRNADGLILAAPSQVAVDRYERTRSESCRGGGAADLDVRK